LGFHAIIDWHARERGTFDAFEQAEQKGFIRAGFRPAGQYAVCRHNGLDGYGLVSYHGGIKREGGMTDRILTADDFAPHIGKSFTLPGQHRALTLVSIDRSTFPGADDLPRAPFTLLFGGPPRDVLPEGLYDVAIPDGPEAAIYISPIQTFDRSRQDYQAVFN
jgi:hypothetical protein